MMAPLGLTVLPPGVFARRGGNGPSTLARHLK
jgi:hypothetical protein